LERAFITQPFSNTWLINWEDWTDGDFNDLIIKVEFITVTIPYLDLPYDYTGSNFTSKSRDTDFYGYDGAPNSDNQPPYNVAYNGHNGMEGGIFLGRLG